MSVMDFCATDDELIGFVKAFSRAMIAADVKYSAMLKEVGVSGVKQVYTDCAKERGVLYSSYLTPRQRIPSGCINTPPLFEPIKAARFYVCRKKKSVEIIAEGSEGGVDFLYVLVYNKTIGWRISSLKSRYHDIDGVRSWQCHSL